MPKACIMNNTTQTHPPTTPTRALFPHERLDAIRVLMEAYDLVCTGQLTTTRGTAGDPLHRALLGAVLRATEAYSARGDNRGALFDSARASSGEASMALWALAKDRKVTSDAAGTVRLRLCRAVQMLTGLTRRK